MRVQPDELREAARHLRYWGSDLDHVRWCMQTAWARLDSGLEGWGCELVCSGYEWVCKTLAAIAESLYRYAWALEATAAWIEEADRQAAAEFMVIEGAEIDAACL